MDMEGKSISVKQSLNTSIYLYWDFTSAQLSKLGLPLPVSLFLWNRGGLVFGLVWFNCDLFPIGSSWKLIIGCSHPPLNQLAVWGISWLSDFQLCLAQPGVLVYPYRTNYRIIPFLVTNVNNYVILENTMAIMLRKTANICWTLMVYIRKYN